MPIYRLLSLLLIIPAALLASLTGTYEASGIDSDGSRYSANVQISRVNAEVFSIFWAFSDGTTSSGTGVQKGSALSFVYNYNGVCGTQLYRIGCHGRLSGPFVELGSGLAGKETLRKQDENPL